MHPAAFLAFVAAVAGVPLAAASVLRRAPTFASWCFAVGMVLLAADSLCGALAISAESDNELAAWAVGAFVLDTCVPAVWLAFSLTYSRGEWRTALRTWRPALVLFAVLPVIALLGIALWPGGLLQVVGSGPESTTLLRSGPLGVALNAAMLIGAVLVLTNLEQTFRASVGTARWRIKLVVVGLAVVFGARIYVRSQSILFTAAGIELVGLEASGLLVGAAILVVAYARSGLGEVDIYPSRAILRSSLTVLIVGSYLFIVGVLAQVVRQIGGAQSFQLQALVLLLGMTGLALLLLSDRLRQVIQAFIGRHFARAQHDSVRVWTALSSALGTARDRTGVCAGAGRLVATTFEVLSVSVWLTDESSNRLELVAATIPRQAGALAMPLEIRDARSPLDLDAVKAAWAGEWRDANPATFPHSGHRWVVPLRQGDASLGAMVLADRVNGAPYSGEALDLLQCIGDQVAVAIRNLRLADELAEARELEAFRTMSAFFVHDLKNAAASLNLMLKNLPVHFDDPEFRADALRGIGNTASRIDAMIAKLSALRSSPAPSRGAVDVNALVKEAIDRSGPLPGVALTMALEAMVPVRGDRDQLVSVVSNLILNARDAVGADGAIHLCTAGVNGTVSVSVQDNGTGMDDAFIRESLFKPFRSTKSKGLGVGMFQARMVVEAHGGQIQVESEEGVGTTVRLLLPVQDA